jgi:hypothetical protein
MASIIEQPPVTGPGPAPRARRPWYKHPLTYVVAIMAMGGLALAGVTLATSTTPNSRPAATAPAKPAQKPQTQAPTPSPGVSQAQQLQDWYTAKGQADVTAVASALTAVGRDEANLAADGNAGKGISGDVRQFNADIAAARQALAAAQRDVPPNDYHGFRTAYAAALGHLRAGVDDTQQIVTDISSGDYSVLPAAGQQASNEMNQASTYLNRAMNVLTS